MSLVTLRFGLGFVVVKDVVLVMKHYRKVKQEIKKKEIDKNSHGYNDVALLALN